MILRLVNYEKRDSAGACGGKVGLLSGDRVVDLCRLQEARKGEESGCSGEICVGSALALTLCPECLAEVRGWAAWFEGLEPARQAELSVPRDQVRLRSPVSAPGKVFCLAQNFPAHAAEASRHISHSGLSAADRMTPHVFMKPTPNTICGDGDPIILPKNGQFIDYEAEVAVVIGRRGKYISAQEAGAYIAGITAMNDVSERDLLVWQREEEREWDHFFDWLNGKWMDNFAPMGPCLVPAGDLDVDNLDVACFVNGEERQQGNTAEMYHSAARTIQYISHMLTLEPGDVIALGTPAGVGKALGKRLQPGDVVTVEVQGVGKLTNPVVAEE